MSGISEAGYDAVARDRIQRLLVVLTQTREAIEYLIGLDGNGKDLVRCLDDEWTQGNEVLARLCIEAGVDDPDLQREGS